MAIPAAVFDGTDIRRLADADRLTPIHDFEELLTVCSRVVEDETLVDDAERCFDGLSRLCGSKPEHIQRRLAPLLRRVHQLLASKAWPFIGMGPWDDLCGAIFAFGTGTVVSLRCKDDQKIELLGVGEDRQFFGENLSKALGFLSRRSLAVAQRIAVGKATPLLSAPTHAGGWINPVELVNRINNWSGDAPDQSDAILALLRLAPDGRAEALKKLKPHSDEWRRAARYALGGEEPVGKTAALWVAAARARSPWTTDPNVEKAFPALGPDAGTAADFAFEFHVDQYGQPRLGLRSIPAAPELADASLPTVILHSQRFHGKGLRFELGGAGGKTVGSVRWSAMIWPIARESYFAAGWEDLVDNLDWWEANWQFRSYLEPLLDSRTPLRNMGLLLLVTGLAAKEPGEQGLAIDAAIRAIEDGRLGSDNLAHAIAQLLPTGIVKPGRWQKAFVDIARTSSVHAAVVHLALQQGLSDATDAQPKGLSKLLELLVELTHELALSIHDPGCREWLHQFGKSGKAKKLAQELLTVRFDDEQTRCARILAEVITMRSARQNA